MDANFGLVELRIILCESDRLSEYFEKNLVLVIFFWESDQKNYTQNLHIIFYNQI